MFLKEIFINGFKSFADKTHVQLQPGVTAVVGPNGCGKSNISDAIRWVLGEQRAKALRGNTMQDVIFDGTDKRKPLPMCEVSLVFSDCEEQLGTAFNEVEIKRRVSRDGSSDYFINGKACRLRDVHNLFMDTGVGRESYSFMAQGQISQLIDASPAGRRVIFEEAAGITRYKTQRKEALNKLERVDQNLARVSDVIEEVSKRIGSLKRQASKTLRFKRLKHRLTHLDLAYNSYQYSQRGQIVKTYEVDSDKLRSIVETATRVVAEAENRLNEDKAARSELTEKVRLANEEVYNLRSAKESAESKAQFAITRREDIDNRIEAIKQEIGELEQMLDELEGQAEEGAKAKAEQLELMGDSDEIFNTRNSEVDDVQRELNQTEEQLRNGRQKYLVLESNITRLRSNSTSLEVEMKTFDARHTQLSDGISEIKSHSEPLHAKVDEVQKTLEIRKTEQANAQEALAAARDSVKQKTQEFRSLQGDIRDQDRSVAKLTAQLSTLEGLQARFEGFSDGAKAILKGELEDVISKKSVRPLAKFLEVDENYTQSIDILLGSASDALTIDERPAVAAISERLREKTLGKACLHVAVPQVSVSEQTLPEWLVAASAVVKSKKEELQAHLDGLISGCYFGGTLQDVFTFWESNPAFPFNYIVTNDGELIDARGLVFGGYRQKGKKDSSLVQREAEIRRLKKEAEQANDLLTDLNQKAMELQEQLTLAEEEVEQRRNEVSSMSGDITGLQAEERAALQAVKQNEDAIARQEGELKRLEEDRERARQKLDSAGDELKQGEEALDACRAENHEFEQQVERLRADRDSRREALNSIRLELAEKRQQLDLITRGLSDVQTRKADAETRVMRRRQEIDVLHEQISSLEDEAALEKQRAEKLEQSVAIAMKQVQQEGDKLKHVENRIEEVDTQLKGKRTELSQNERQLHELDVSLAKEKSQIEFLYEKVQSEYEIDVAGVNWKEHLWKADDKFETKVNMDDLEDDESLDVKSKDKRGEPTEEDFKAMDETDWKPIEDEIKALKSRIASMGEVNLVAIEEYAELKERYDFLKSQSDDLWNSKEELLKAIEEINETSQKMFSETFEQVRKNFQFTFERLNGGKADLSLMNAEDVLDSGIEIFAQPVGTKIKSLSLMSGGQKTMTAVSLLFAIYMVKPSPFCVLDELDAPLDDVNIGRFTDMLTSFLDYSQFLVITHNKRTLHVANTLYGVTMQEPGVTKLVSLRFNKDGKADIAEEEEAINEFVEA